MNSNNCMKKSKYTHFYIFDSIQKKHVERWLRAILVHQNIRQNRLASTESSCTRKHFLGVLEKKKEGKKKIMSNRSVAFKKKSRYFSAKIFKRPKWWALSYDPGKNLKTEIEKMLRCRAEQCDAASVDSTFFFSPAGRRPRLRLQGCLCSCA